MIVSHGHSDHSGGAKYLQDRFNARVMLSAADWDLLDRERPARKPKRDMVATDGQKLTLGDTTMTMYLTPGHTPGTSRTSIPVKDDGAPHLVAEWGGTAFNFPRTPDNFKTYAASAERFGDDRGKGRRRRDHLEPLRLRRLEAEDSGAARRASRRSEPVRRRQRLGEALHEVAEECAKAWVGRAGQAHQTCQGAGRPLQDLFIPNASRRKPCPLILPVFVRSAGALEALRNTTMRVPDIVSSPDASLKRPVPPVI